MREDKAWYPLLLPAWGYVLLGLTAGLVGACLLLALGFLCGYRFF